MATTCAQCGTAAAIGATFCGKCGATLGGTPSVGPTQRRSKRRTIDSRHMILVASALIVTIVLGALGYRWRTTSRGAPTLATSAAPAQPVVQPGPPPETDSLVQLAEEAETLSHRQGELTRDMQTTIARYQQKSGGSLPSSIGAELTDEQRALLSERIKSERMGTASLLQDLLAKDKELQDLRKRLTDVNGRLPDSVIAADGQRHERIAMDYLTGKGLNTEDAYTLVSQASLTEPLIQGFRVFLLYQNGQFGTWVTQGNANTSPKAVHEQVIKLATQERDAAKQALEDANADRADLRNMANAADKSLQDTQADLKAMHAATERQLALNSTLRYVVGSKSELVKNKVIDGNLRLLPAVSEGSALPANVPTTLPPIDPSVHGLKRVKRVTIVPGLVAEGSDFTVNDTDGFISLSIARPERFSQYAKFFVVVLE